jgi:hypothetical protein
LPKHWRAGVEQTNDHQNQKQRTGYKKAEGGKKDVEQA